MPKFSTTLHASGKNTTGIIVPPAIVEALGAGRKPPVTVRIGSYGYRSTIASMGGQYMIPVSAERRAEAGLAAGDPIDVELEVDTAPREIAIPGDLTAALAAEPEAGAFFATLSNSNRQRIVLALEGAKTTETRERRLATALANLRAGKA